MIDNPTEAFRSAMAAAGLSFNGQILADGKLHRVNCDNESGIATWFVLHQTEKFAAGCFGDWRKQIQQTWNSANGTPLTPEEKRELSRQIAEAQNLRKTAEEQLRAEAKSEAQKALSAGTIPSSHPYLERKKIKAHGEIRVSADNLLLLPIRDVDGSLHSLQFIAPDKRFSHNRDKNFVVGGQLKSHFYSIGEKHDGPLVVCEGYATGASIHEATGWTVACAMFANNLSSVALALRKKYPSRVIIIAADNDRFTENNPGLTSAKAAAQQTKSFVAVPEFADNDDSSTDFNDLACLSGLDAIKALFSSVVSGDNSDWSILLEDASDTLTQDIPDPVEIVDGLITECSKVVIGGGSKTYKTWVSINLAIACACKSKFLGRACLPQRVLYVNLELKKSTFKRRLQIVSKAMGTTINSGSFMELHLRGRLGGLSVLGIMDRIIHAAKSFGATMVILDPVYKLNVEGDENSSRDQTLLFNQIDRITTECKCTVVLNDHFGKGNQSEKDPLDAIRGSSAKGGDVDAAIILRAHESNDSYRVDVVHRELPPIEPFVITWEFPLFSLDTCLDPNDMKKAKGSKKKYFEPEELLSLIKDRTSKNPISFSEWSRLAKIPRTSLLEYAETMRKRGWLMTIGEGSSARQAISPSGLKACS